MSRDFFKENMMRQVMNGKEINFWKDRWIPEREIKGLMIEGREDN